MSIKKNKATKSTEKPSAKDQAGPDGGSAPPSDSPTQIPFLVMANVNLAAVAEFVIHGNTKAEAGKAAELLLDKLQLQVTAASGPGPDVFVDIPEACLDCEVVEVRPLKPGWVFDPDAVRANTVASVGALVQSDIERLVRSCAQDEGGREHIRAALISGMRQGLFDKIWESYSKLVSEPV